MRDIKQKPTNKPRKETDIIDTANSTVVTNSMKEGWEENKEGKGFKYMAMDED